MSLDMHLSKHTYITNKPDTPPLERLEVGLWRGYEDLTNKKIKPDRVTYISEEVATWDGACAIHQWFRDKLDYQEGPTLAEPEELKELLDATQQVLESTKLVPGMVRHGHRWIPATGYTAVIEPGELLEDTSIAEVILPLAEHWECDYDGDYWRSLEKTRDILEAVLKEDRADAEFFYYGG